MMSRAGADSPVSFWGRCSSAFWGADGQCLVVDQSRTPGFSNLWHVYLWGEEWESGLRPRHADMVRSECGGGVATVSGSLTGRLEIRPVDPAIEAHYRATCHEVRPQYVTLSKLATGFYLLTFDEPSGVSMGGAITSSLWEQDFRIAFSLYSNTH